MLRRIANPDFSGTLVLKLFYSILSEAEVPTPYKLYFV